MKLNGRRRALAWALGVLTASAAVQAQEFPVKPVRMVVPFGAGTTTDIVARVVAEGMSRVLGQAVVVENRAGAGGGIGSDLVAKAPADGYTIVMGTVGTHAINATLYKRLPYDPQRDFAPVSFTGYTPTLLVVPGNSPLKSIKDLAEQAKRADARVSFASAGNGTSGHLAGELLKARLGGEMTHVPYKEGGLALSDVMSGQVQFMFSNLTAALPQIKSGKMRALAVTGAKRSGSVAELPTMSEAGVPGYAVTSWFALLAPNGVAPDILKRLHAETVKAMSAPDMKDKLAGEGAEPMTSTPAELTAFLKAEIAQWGRVVKAAGIKAE